MFILRKCLYKVDIPYYEPTFALRLGRKVKYYASIIVNARNPKKAIRLALKEFTKIRGLSRTPWPYDIIYPEISIK